MAVSSAEEWDARCVCRLCRLWFSGIAVAFRKQFPKLITLEIIKVRSSGMPSILNANFCVWRRNGFRNCDYLLGVLWATLSSPLSYL